MRKFATRILVAVLLAGTAAFSSTPSQAEAGRVAVVFTKGGFILLG